MKTNRAKKIGEWKLPEECLACDAEDSYRRVRVETEKEIRGETFAVSHHSWRCQECGEGVLGPEEMDEAMRAVIAAYQKAHGLLTAEGIVASRKKAGLSQKGLAEASGLGVASTKRWEGGLVLQTLANDKVLRKALSNSPGPATNPMKIIKKNLSTIGITRNYLRDFVFPAGWDDTEAQRPEGLLAITQLLFQRFGFAPDSLLGNLRFATGVEARFKKRATTAVNELRLCRAMCGQFGKMLAGALSGSPRKSLPPASELREFLLEVGTGTGIGFAHLVNTCWDHGIAVVHLSNFPKCKKPDAMVMVIEDRPVIVVCKNTHSAAWMIFILAHEMGHIYEGHVTNEAPFVDEELKMPGEGISNEEKEANDYAVGLLMDDLRLVWQSLKLKPADLVRLARHQGKKLQISPGSVALSYAYQEGHWQIANAALKTLEKSEPDPIETINRIAYDRLDWEGVQEGSQEWFLKMTGVLLV